MTITANTRTCILLAVWVGLLGCFSGAALQQSQQQPAYTSNAYQSYSQNVLDEQRKPIRAAANAPYDHVDDLEIRVLDRFDHRYPDGSYEYRFELSDGTARYERGYFLSIDKKKELVVVGYYSYRMPNGQFVTVFYNADRYGYRQNQSITRDAYPELPRTIEVPQIKDAPTAATTLRPSFVTSTTTKRNKF